MVASEFSLMKNAVGDELHSIREGFEKMKPGKEDDAAEEESEEKGPGPFPITEQPDTPMVDLNQGASVNNNS